MPVPTIGNEIIVQSSGGSSLLFPTVAAMTDGGFVVANLHGSDFFFEARPVSATGTPAVYKLPIHPDSGTIFSGTASIENRVEAIGLPNGDVAFAHLWDIHMPVNPASRDFYVTTASTHHDTVMYAESTLP